MQQHTEQNDNFIKQDMGDCGGCRRRSSVVIGGSTSQAKQCAIAVKGVTVILAKQLWIPALPLSVQASRRGEIASEGSRDSCQRKLCSKINAIIQSVYIPSSCILQRKNAAAEA